MPPRIPLPSPSGFSNLCVRSAPKSNAQLPITSTASVVTMAQRRKYKDPYAVAQAKQRKEANQSRQAELSEQRKITRGDPVRGISTPFLESFDNVGGSTTLVEAEATFTMREAELENEAALDEAGLEIKTGLETEEGSIVEASSENEAGSEAKATFSAMEAGSENEAGSEAEALFSPIKAKSESKPELEIGLEMPIADNAMLNHFITASEFKSSINHSIALVAPVEAENRSSADPDKEKADFERFKARHENATIAMARIVSLANSSQQDRTRANIARCIDTFGRHRTDETLRPRAPPNPAVMDDAPATKTPRAGPDTGSSEVQIAILTAKIRVLANQLEMKGGKKDKVNKRNLRVMVHKRQKHLQYLRKKERGGDRWQHLINTLGLSEGTWKGEISL